MTVYESIAGWLNSILTAPENNFPQIGTVIDLENIPNWQEMANSGLFSSPNDQHDSLMAGGQKHTEFKSFYFRKSFSDFTERLSNEAFFEKLRQCIYEKNMNRDFPSDNRNWRSIEINGGIYAAQRSPDNLTADYLIPLKICYIQ